MVVFGSYGDDVKRIQNMINTLGYKLGVDGSFGKLTESAVKNYQGLGHNVAFRNGPGADSEKVPGVSDRPIKATTTKQDELDKLAKHTVCATPVLYILYLVNIFFK